MKKTPLYQQHLNLGGRMVEFAGWALPIEYKSSLLEAKACRTTCGIFDASHMGEIELSGSEVLPFIQKLLSNDLSLIIPGQMQYNLVINSRGGVIDDCMVYRLKDSFLCVVNASNKDKVLAWFNKNIQGGVKVTDRSDEFALLSLQGPKAYQIIADCLGSEAVNLDYMHFLQGESSGKHYLLSRSGYTGEDGFEFYVPCNDAVFWWDEFFQKGKKSGITPCGLGSRDILRIEVGYPLYGHELNDDINPYEAVLGWAVKLDKEFLGKKEIARVKKEGLAKQRVGFVMEERSMPRQGYPVYCEGKVAGEVSSGTFSPNLDKFIGMAYLDKARCGLGTEIKIKIRDKFYRAKVAKFPFVTPKTKKLANQGV